MRRRCTSVIALCALLVLVGQQASADTPRQRLARAQDRLDELSSRLEIKIEDCNLRREQLKAAKRAVNENRAKVAKTRATLAEVDDQRGKVVAEMYKQRTGGQELASLTTSVDSLSDYAERMAWLDITNDARTGAFEKYDATRTRLAADGDVLKATREDATDANAVAQRSCEETRRRVEAEEDRITELSAEVERLEARREAAAQPDTASASDSSAPVPAPAVAGSAGAAVQFALAQVGKPYAWGGSGPGSYDCSGLTSAAWAAAGVSLPHSSSMQYSATARVSRSALQPGDLMFFGSPIHHVAMYVGNGQMVESPHSGLTVRVVSADRSDYVGAGRP